MLRLHPPFALSLSKGERLDAQHDGLSKGEPLRCSWFDELTTNGLPFALSVVEG
jgi:hypothetical protein